MISKVEHQGQPGQIIVSDVLKASNSSLKSGLLLVAGVQNIFCSIEIFLYV